MRKVLLVPLLMLVPLAGLQALSTNGQTPGAAVLQGGLGAWALETVEAGNLPRGNGISTLRQPAANAAREVSIDIKAARTASQPVPVLAPGFPTCWIDAEGRERGTHQLRIDEADLFDDPSGLPGIAESGTQTLVTQASTPASDLDPIKQSNTSRQD